MGNRASLAAALGLVLAVTGCGTFSRKLPPATPIPEPDPEDVESVVFLVGDTGELQEGASPLMARLRQDVEEWSARLGRDSAVSVLVLGDIIYPVGLRPPESAYHDSDMRVLMRQVEIVDGPAARRHRSFMTFIAGNHDWAKVPAPEGLIQLERLDEAIDAIRAETGLLVRLVPEPGEPGPYVLDVGRHLRMILIDTGWWLFTQAPRLKEEMLDSVAVALASGGDRAVVMAAHHPWATGGAHGGLIPFWETVGVEYLLYKSGALLQDLNSLPYTRLRNRLRQIFREVIHPLVFAAGHDHSLQVLYRSGAHEPRHILVSGSASKLTDVGWAPGMRFRASKPGYMRLTVSKNGDVSVFVTAAPEDYLFCEPDGEAAEAVPPTVAAGSDGDAVDPVEACMARGIAAFETVYSARLR